jgi:DNA invertase Pin-like site-specific DNA recombinase
MLIKPYYRRSKADKKRRLSIELQQEEFERWCKDHPDAHPLAARIDDGKSAFTENPAKRPAFLQLMQEARAQEFNAIWVYMYDRFSRKIALSGPYLEELDRIGIRVISATESEDWETRAQASLDAEKFSRRLSIRMQSVKYFDARRGRWVGAVPFGYDRVDGYLVPNSDAWIVSLIFDLYVTNRYSIMDIVDELRARNLQRHSICHHNDEPYAFGGQSIRQILTNRAYLGESRCGSITVPDAHAHIITQDTWDAAQEIRARRATHHGRLTVQAPDRGILTGVVRCAICDAPMWHNKSGKGWRYYTCSRHSRYHSCDNHIAKTDDVDRYAIHLLSRLRLPEDWQQQALALITAEQHLPATDAAQIEREIRTLRTQAIDGQISIEDFKRREAALKAQLVEHTQLPLVDLEGAAARIRDFSTLVTNATPDEQRALVTTIFSSIWLRSSVIEAWAPRAVYQPLFATLYDLTVGRETSAERPPPKPSPFYPALWTSFHNPLAVGGAR